MRNFSNWRVSRWQAAALHSVVISEHALVSWIRTSGMTFVLCVIIFIHLQNLICSKILWYFLQIREVFEGRRDRSQCLVITCFQAASTRELPCTWNLQCTSLRHVMMYVYIVNYAVDVLKFPPTVFIILVWCCICSSLTLYVIQTICVL